MVWVDAVSSSLCGFALREDESSGMFNVNLVYTYRQKSDNTEQKDKPTSKSNIYGVWCIDLGITKREAIMSLKDNIKLTVWEVNKEVFKEYNFMSFTNVIINGIKFNSIEVRAQNNRVHKIDLKIDKEDMLVVNDSYDKLFDMLNEKYGKGMRIKDYDFPTVVWDDNETGNGIMLTKFEDMLSLMYIKVKEDILF